MTADDGIEPDTKDWTWVLQRACPECGQDVSSVPGPEVPARLRQAAEQWHELLNSGRDVRTRPGPGTWSPLEYACHARDVFVVFDRRFAQLLEQDRPRFANWDQDASAVQGRYAEQDPAVVADEVPATGRVLTDRLAAVRPEQWAREGRRSDGAEFTTETLARYLLHDVLHHLHDVGLLR